MEQMKDFCICSFPSLWHNHNASFKKGLTPTVVLFLFMLLYFVNKTTPVIYDVEKFVCALFLDYFFCLSCSIQTIFAFIFQCSTNSKALPRHTVNIVKDHSEMADWVDSDPFYISTNNYTKIVVDRVQAADQRFYNILLLATGMSLFNSTGSLGSCFVISAFAAFQLSYILRMHCL